MTNLLTFGCFFLGALPEVFSALDEEKNCSSYLLWVSPQPEEAAQAAPLSSPPPVHPQVSDSPLAGRLYDQR